MPRHLSAALAEMCTEVQLSMLMAKSGDSINDDIREELQCKSLDRGCTKESKPFCSDAPKIMRLSYDRYHGRIHIHFMSRYLANKIIQLQKSFFCCFFFLNKSILCVRRKKRKKMIMKALALGSL